MTQKLLQVKHRKNEPLDLFALRVWIEASQRMERDAMRAAANWIMAKTNSLLQEKGDW